MKTIILEAYNRYVILANRYRFEHPAHEEKQEQVFEVIQAGEAVPPVLLKQSRYLRQSEGMLFVYARRAHFDLTRVLKPEGWDQGDNVVAVPLTTRLGDMVIAPRYEQQLREALEQGMEEVDVPFEMEVRNISGNEGTPLIYGYTGLFGNFMPYYIKPTVNK